MKIEQYKTRKKTQTHYEFNQNRLTIKKKQLVRLSKSRQYTVNQSNNKQYPLNQKQFSN